MISSVGSTNVQALDDQFSVFVQQWPRLAWLRERLKAAGLEPTSARELRRKGARSSWIVIARPAESLLQHFELAPEVLILVSPWAETHAQDLKGINEAFVSEMRVDPGFAVLITRDHRAEERLQPVLSDRRAHVFVSEEEFEVVQDPQAWLRGKLRETLGARRLFDHRLPAAGPQFFGRDKEFEALSRDLSRGHCLGVFGLRKVGKTSLLRRAAEKLREGGVANGRALVIEVELQLTDYRHRDFVGVAELIGSRLDVELARDKTISQTAAVEPLKRLEQTVALVEREYGARTMLFLDEYEVLLDGRIPKRDGVNLLSWLRGLAQSHPSGFNLVLAGRNAQLVAPARIDGVDNPMYRFLRDVPLAGLSPEDCRAMLRKIGGRMGLKFANEALDFIAAETGGHPALARTFGDLIDQSISPEARVPAKVDLATVQRVFPRFCRAVEDDMRELVEAAKDIDPRAEDRLVHLAFGLSWIGGAIEGRIDDALMRYGILLNESTEFRIRQLGRWLCENYQRPTVAAHG